MGIRRPRKSGKTSFDISKGPMGTEKLLESMQNQLSPSGIFPRTHNIADYQRD